jgi:hypothetical protein
MGYTTDFYGAFNLSRPLTVKEARILNDFADVRHENTSGQTFPGIWCHWVPDEDEAKTIIWNGLEKFYSYELWLQYIYDNFLKPWGVELSGVVYYQGEESKDYGGLYFKDGVVYKVDTPTLTLEFLKNSQVNFLGEVLTNPKDADRLAEIISRGNYTNEKL